MEAFVLDPVQRARMLGPEPVTLAWPGIGGHARSRPEDFVVDEVAAYPPDGRPDRHLLVRIEKRGLTTAEAVGRLARAMGVDRRAIGVAGQKDKHALTRQWVSLPWAARESLEAAGRGAEIEGPQLRVLEWAAHGQKLRTGHLRANRFILVLRELDVGLEEARRRAEVKLAVLARRGGLENLYGEQRFGHEGRNLDRGLALLRRGRFDRRCRFEASAGQAGVFNLYLAERRRLGIDRQVLAGDVLRKRDRGGLFDCVDPAVDQARLEAGEIDLTGPLPGAKTRWCVEGSDAARLEEEILARVGLDREGLRRHGKRLPGSRRSLHVPLAVEIDVAEAVEGFGPGLRFRFELPPGSYATQVLRELQNGTAAATSVNPEDGQ